MKKIKVNIKLAVLLAVIYASAVNAQPAALWTKYYNNFLANKDDNIVKSITDNSGNIYILGSTLNSQNNWDILTIKYDGSGNLKWVRVYNGETNDTDIPEDICLDPQGNVYIAGETVGLNSVIDGMVLKYDTTGTLKFTRLYNRTNIAGKKAYSQNIIYKNALYVTCRFLYNDQKECGIMKLTTLGDSLTYRVLGSGSDHFFSHAMTYDDQGYIYVSTYGKYNPGEENDIGVYKMNNNTMNIEWTKKIQRSKPQR